MLRTPPSKYVQPRVENWKGKWADDGSVLCECLLPAVCRTTKKEGPNLGRQFWVCEQAQGEQCKTFLWDDKIDNSKPSIPPFKRPEVQHAPIDAEPNDDAAVAAPSTSKNRATGTTSGEGGSDDGSSTDVEDLLIVLPHSKRPREDAGRAGGPMFTPTPSTTSTPVVSPAKRVKDVVGSSEGWKAIEEDEGSDFYARHARLFPSSSTSHRDRSSSPLDRDSTNAIAAAAGSASKGEERDVVNRSRFSHVLDTLTVIQAEVAMLKKEAERNERVSVAKSKTIDLLQAKARKDTTRINELENQVEGLKETARALRE